MLQRHLDYSLTYSLRVHLQNPAVNIRPDGLDGLHVEISAELHGDVVQRLQLLRPVGNLYDDWLKALLHLVLQKNHGRGQLRCGTSR